jgi:hypothetical protein
MDTIEIQRRAGGRNHDRSQTRGTAGTIRKLLLAAAASSLLFFEPVSAATFHARQFRILDLNISGSEKLAGQSDLIAWYIKFWAQLHGANVIALQEVCATQHNAILAALRQLHPYWTGTWKSFGPKDGCYNQRHGLSVFTLGSHAGLQWWYLDSKTNAAGYRWWGLMKVRYAGLDIFNVHIRDASKQAHIPAVAAEVDASPLFVLAGDFNEVPHDPLMVDFFTSRFYEVDYDDREYTIGPRSCIDADCLALRRKIDYIWTNRLPKSIWGDAVHSPSNHRLLLGVVEHWFWN